MKKQSKSPIRPQTSQKPLSPNKKPSSPNQILQNPPRIPLLSNNTSNGMIESQAQELLVMTIDLGNGRNDMLKVFEGDDPFQLASRFVEKHKLDAKVVEPLAQNIYTNMEQVLEASVETLNMVDNTARKETVPKDIDLSGMTPELNAQKYQIEDHNLSGISHSPKYADDEDAYQFLDNGEGNDSPLIAERIGVVQPKSFSSAVQKSLNKPSLKSAINNRVNAGYQKKAEEKQAKFAAATSNSAKQLKTNGSGGNEAEKKQVTVKNPETQAIRRWPGPSQLMNGQYKREEIKVAKTEPVEVKQEQSISKTVTNTTSGYSPKSINYGALLYHRELIKNDQTNRQVAQMRKQNLELADRECTFTPEVNSISEQITSTKGRMENVSDLLIQAGKTKQYKLERARSAQMMKEQEECSFQPQINKASQRIEQQKSQMSFNVDEDRCLRLYQGAKGRKDQKELAATKLPAEYTFKPATKEYKEGSVAQTTFEERDRKFKERLERISQLREIKEAGELVDMETGEELFKPKVGRAPKSGRNSDNLPVGEYLYNKHSKNQEIRKNINEKMRPVTAKTVKNEKSQAIVENLLKKKLEEIFKSLDTDGDGLISSGQIDITQVDLNVLEALAPVLCEMEQSNQTLDFEKFFEQTERLLKVSTITERNKLILEKKTVVEPQYSYQPAIAKKSEKLAQKKHPYGDFVSLYESYTNEKKKFEMKMQEEKAKKAQDELKECTFKPTMYTKKATTARNSSNFANNYFMEDMII